jgi:2-polyprenyl-3-methyl-5-hydroxy-6-metoxy-1,4-benzoquinol methylase
MNSLEIKKIFDEKYFEDGVRHRVSAYENYRWMPERSIREASSIINNISFTTVLDFGCAKGFMVYALRLLGKDAHGVDVSQYAVGNCHPNVKDYLTVIDNAEDIKGGWDLIIAKDVLEHIPKEEILSVLVALRRRCKTIFIAVPLGDGIRYRIREYAMDISHVTKEPEEWWLTTLFEAGFKIKYFDYQFHHLKENWTVSHPFGNAFIVAE